VYRWLTVLLPHLALLVIDSVAADADGVLIRGHARAARSRCGLCEVTASRTRTGPLLAGVGIGSGMSWVRAQLLSTIAYRPTR
jgi:hypothetical protein